MDIQPSIGSYIGILKSFYFKFEYIYDDHIHDLIVQIVAKLWLSITIVVHVLFLSPASRGWGNFSRARILSSVRFFCGCKNYQLIFL